LHGGDDGSAPFGIVWNFPSPAPGKSLGSVRDVPYNQREAVAAIAFGGVTTTETDPPRLFRVSLI